MLAVFSSSLEIRLEPLNLPTAAHQTLTAQSVNLAATDVPPGLSTEMSQAVEQAIAIAFVDGFRVVMVMAVILAIASAAIAALTIERPIRRDFN